MQETQSLCCELKNSGESRPDRSPPPRRSPWRPSILGGGCGLNDGWKQSDVVWLLQLSEEPRSSQPGGRTGEGPRPTPPTPFVVVGVIRRGGGWPLERRPTTAATTRGLTAGPRDNGVNHKRGRRQDVPGSVDAV